jgi:hypothetical protein
VNARWTLWNPDGAVTTIGSFAASGPGVSASVVVAGTAASFAGERSRVPSSVPSPQPATSSTHAAASGRNARRLTRAPPRA